MDAFVAEARRFLDESAERRVPVEQRREFRWGEGPDRVELFAEPSPGEEEEELREVKRWQRAAFDAGFAWITGPPQYGGRGLPSSYQRAYDDLEREYVVPNRSALGIGLGMVAPTLLAHGTDEAKNRWLRPLYRGDAIGCQLFSEPGAGSDLAAVRTTAERGEDGWVVNGQKVWTSGAHFSDVGLLLARSSPGPRHRNLTAFVIDMKSEGVDIRPLRQITGGSAFNEVFLDNVAVPDEWRLGDVDGGWRVAITTLMNERAAISGDSAGTGLFSLARLIAFARQMGRSEDPMVRQQLAQLYVDLTVWRLNRARATARRKTGQPPGPEMSMAKIALTRNLASLGELVGELLGPRLTADNGDWGTFAWSRFVLGVPGVRLGGGTDEVLKNVVGERVLDLPREPAGK